MEQTIIDLLWLGLLCVVVPIGSTLLVRIVSDRREPRERPTGAQRQGPIVGEQAQHRLPDVDERPLARPEKPLNWDGWWRGE